MKGQDIKEVCGAPNGHYDAISQGAANEFRIPLRLVTPAHRKVMKAILFPLLYCNMEGGEARFQPAGSSTRSPAPAYSEC